MRPDTPRSREGERKEKKKAREKLLNAVVGSVCRPCITPPTCFIYLLLFYFVLNCLVKCVFIVWRKNGNKNDAMDYIRTMLHRCLGDMPLSFDCMRNMKYCPVPAFVHLTQWKHSKHFPLIFQCHAIQMPSSEHVPFIRSGFLCYQNGNLNFT